MLPIPHSVLESTVGHSIERVLPGNLQTLVGIQCDALKRRKESPKANPHADLGMLEWYTCDWIESTALHSLPTMCSPLPEHSALQRPLATRDVLGSFVINNLEELDPVLHKGTFRPHDFAKLLEQRRFAQQIGICRVLPDPKPLELLRHVGPVVDPTVERHEVYFLRAVVVEEILALLLMDIPSLHYLRR